MEFWVAGEPKPGGSKRGFYNAKLKRVMMTEDCDKTKNWRASVAQCAAEVAKEVFQGPLRVQFKFVFLRPKGHYGTGSKAGVVKASAPAFPSGRPDTTKLIRSTEDALTGILWRDDAQVVTQYATKRYGAQAGCLVSMEVESE
jgi:Holliday junction resolvase RusA-like endonuclease